MTRLREFIQTDDKTVTVEMKDFFMKRTAEHINRVKENVKYLSAKSDALPGRGVKLLKQVITHDQSKYHNPEVIPYIHITWRRKLQKMGIEYKFTDEIQEQMNQATLHHILQNKHHPEYHDPSFREESFNKADRDKPGAEPVNGTLMDTISLAEMVCDWTSLTQETLGHSDCSQWANDNISVRWNFTPNQINYIYHFITDMKGKGV